MVIFKPLGDRIKIKQTVKKQIGSIIIPGKAGEQNDGTIVVIGQFVPEDAGLHVGQRVVFGKYAGFQFREGDDVFQVMPYGDVVGELEGEEEEVGKDYNRTLGVSNSTKTVFEEYAKGE